MTFVNVRQYIMIVSTVWDPTELLEYLYDGLSTIEWKVLHPHTLSLRKNLAKHEERSPGQTQNAFRTEESIFIGDLGRGQRVVKSFTVYFFEKMNFTLITRMVALQEAVAPAK